MTDRSATIRARGHPNVRATHEKTLELTPDSAITQAGTCIVGVGAQVDQEALSALRGPVEITLSCGEARVRVRARMNPLYLPGDPLIVRREDRAKLRTLAIDASHGSADLDRALVEALRAPGAELEVTLREVGAERGPGALFLIGVPIGNDDDLSPRASRALRAADVVACEDTRTSRVLLDAVGARGRRLSYHDHNETERAEELAGLLAEGARVAVISDAGMPGVADPGQRVVRRAHEVGAVVSVIPGPCAALLGVVGSGFPTDTFTFAGFLPKNAKARTAALRAYAAARPTVVVYEAPHRAEETLEAIAEIYGERDIAVARELTKTNEELVRGPASELLQTLKTGDRLRGELTIVLPGAAPSPVAEDDEAPPWLEPMCRALLDADVPKTTIAAAIRAATGWPKKRGYAYVLGL